MTFEQRLQLVQVILPALLGVLSAFMALLFKILHKGVKNEHANQLLDRLEKITAQTVQEVSQTFVDELKATGEFDAVAQAEAKERAVKRVLDILGKQGISVLNECLGSTELYIRTLIESEVRQG